MQKVPYYTTLAGAAAAAEAIAPKKRKAKSKTAAKSSGKSKGKAFGKAGETPEEKRAFFARKNYFAKMAGKKGKKKG